MSLPFDQRITKLKLQLRRADVALYEQEKAYEAALRIIREPYNEALQQRISLFTNLMQIAGELGYCGNCEKPMAECKCVWLANGSQKIEPVCYEQEFNVKVTRAPNDG